MTQLIAEPCSTGVIRSAPACPQDIASGRRRIVLTACILASSMAFIDSSALTVALPRLRATLGTDLASAQWVLNGYVLALASLTLVGGALADVHGRARVLSVGCLLFGATSAGCSLAPSAGWLIAMRVGQGMAAALVTPASLALIGAIYPKNERSGAIGVWAAASALTTAAGPILGGWLVERFGWQSIFWINPPIALAAAVLLIGFAPADSVEPRRFDFAGAGIIAAALGSLAWGLSQMGSAGTQSSPVAWIAVAILASFAGLAAYASWERMTEHPMTPPRLAANRLFIALNAGTLFVYAGVSIMFFLLPFDLIDRRALSSTDAGLAFLPFTLAVGLFSRAFGRLADKIGAKTMLVLGPAGAACAYSWMAQSQTSSFLGGVIAPITLLGISFAVFVAPLTASVLSSVDEADEGLASGINNAVSRIAQLAGIALAAGLGPIAAGYRFGLWTAAVLSAAGALTAALGWPVSVSLSRKNSGTGTNRAGEA